MIQIILWFYLECLKILLSYNIDLLHIKEPELKCIGCKLDLFCEKCKNCPTNKHKGTFFNIF